MTMTKHTKPRRVALMSIETDGEVIHLRRYVSAPRTRLTCTHEGSYVAASAAPHAVLSYLEHGAAQDRRAA